jgi:hypothetical protein
MSNPQRSKLPFVLVTLVLLGGAGVALGLASMKNEAPQAQAGVSEPLAGVEKPACSDGCDHDHDHDHAPKK